MSAPSYEARQDAIYTTVENKKFCREHRIRLSGRARKKEAADLTVQSTEQQELFKSDLRKRSVIEGGIGTSKRKYGLDRILTKLVATSRSVIGMAFFVMNSEKILRLLRLLMALFVSVCIAIMRLFVPERRTAVLGAF